MFSRSLARPLARILSSSSPSFRPSLSLPLASTLSRNYTGVSSRSSVQTLIHLSLDGAEESEEGIHTLTDITEKRLGDRVEEGEVLGYIEHTIRTEILAPCSGNIQRVLFAEGDQVEVGEDLFVLQQEDDDEEQAGNGSYVDTLLPSDEHDLDLDSEGQHNDDLIDQHEHDLIEEEDEEEEDQDEDFEEDDERLRPLTEQEEHDEEEANERDESESLEDEVEGEEEEEVDADPFLREPDGEERKKEI